MNHPTLIAFTATILIMLASAAFAGIAFVPEERHANMSGNDTIGLWYQLKNTGNETACISLETDQDDAYIDTHLTQDKICLNEHESTNVTVTISTENAPSGTQLVLLEAKSEQGNTTASAYIRISEEPEIELVAYPNDICRGTQEHINVLIRNNSDEFKEVELQAENEMLLPYFERKAIGLMPQQEKYVELRVHPSPYSSMGRHYVSMYARTDDETVKETVTLDVEDCDKEEARFTVDISTRSCFVVDKEEDEKIYFSVENLLEEEQKIYFSTGGGLPTRLQTSSAWLEEKEEREFYFEVKADERARVKDYNVTLKVWNSTGSIEKSLCVRPRKEHITEANVRENNLVIRQCESAVFTILLENNGDYYEDFELEVDNDNSKIEAVLSDDDVRLEKRSSKEAYVSVNVLEYAKEGNYSITLEINTDDEDFEKELMFKVVEKEAPIELPSLEITGYASSVRMDENSEKSILVRIKNNGETVLENVTVEMDSLPKGVTATFERNIGLLPGQEKEFELFIQTEEETEGEYNVMLLAHNTETSTEKMVTLIAETAEEEPVEEIVIGSMAGLFAAGGSALLGLAVLVIVITALVLIARVLRTPNTKKEKETWMRG